MDCSGLSPWGLPKLAPTGQAQRDGEVVLSPGAQGSQGWLLLKLGGRGGDPHTHLTAPVLALWSQPRPPPRHHVPTSLPACLIQAHLTPSRRPHLNLCLNCTCKSLYADKILGG